MMPRWFDQLGNCHAPFCGKTAVGILRGERNEEIGKFCMKCAQVRLADARAAARTHGWAAGGL